MKILLKKTALGTLGVYLGELQTALKLQCSTKSKRVKQGEG